MTKRSAAGEALTELILEVFRFNGVMLHAGNRITKPHGLTSARWQVMGSLELAGQSLTVAQIARRMGLARQGVQRIANDLAKLGMVTFEDNVDHKRAPLVSITEQGASVLVEIDQVQTKWVNQLAEKLNATKLDDAVSLLTAVRQQADKENQDDEENWNARIQGT